MQSRIHFAPILFLSAQRRLLQRAVKKDASAASHHFARLQQALLCDLERPDVGNLMLQPTCRVPQIDLALQIQPELR